MGRLQAIRDRLNGGFTKLVPYIGAAAVTGAGTIYLFAPNAPRGQLVMIGELCLAIGLALGYMAGAQLPEEAEE